MTTEPARRHPYRCLSAYGKQQTAKEGTTQAVR